jgi:hypothetical protein
VNKQTWGGKLKSKGKREKKRWDALSEKKMEI